MKLRNKKTGKIHEITEFVPLHDMAKKFVIYSKTEGHNYAYKNLAELNEEWEDYKESKEAYFITEYGEVFPLNVYEDDNSVATVDEYKQIGNYFGSREEAEKAVKKLKAFANLRKRGLKFNGWDEADRGMVGEFAIYCDALELDGIERELEIVFGREEL